MPLGLNQCRVTSRDTREDNSSVALFQTWDPYRALDPCLFDLALNLRGVTNVLGRIFQDRKTAASTFFKTKGGKRVDLGLLLAVWLAGATCRWKAAQTTAPVKLLRVFG